LLGSFVTLLAGVGRLECGPEQRKPAQAASHVQPEFEAYVSLQGLIDVEKEMKRLQKLLDEKGRQLQAAEAKLTNSNFVDKAPPDVVQQQKDLVATLKEQIKVIESNLKDLRQQ
jgi:valyl-tRNA synthetase